MTAQILKSARQSRRPLRWFGRRRDRLPRWRCRRLMPWTCPPRRPTPTTRSTWLTRSAGSCTNRARCSCYSTAPLFRCQPTSRATAGCSSPAIRSARCSRTSICRWHRPPGCCPGRLPIPQPGWSGYTVPFNTLGIPTISVPCGFLRAGFPIGLQVSGPSLGEAQVLAPAHAYEQATGWHHRLPALS